MGKVRGQDRTWGGRGGDKRLKPSNLTTITTHDRNLFSYPKLVLKSVQVFRLKLDGLL